VTKGGLTITRVVTTTSSDNDFKDLPQEIQNVVTEYLELLLTNHKAKKLRFEKLSGHKKPPIYTIHVTPNHSHKASMEIIDGIAKLRRIGTHKKIDRNP